MSEIIILARSKPRDSHNFDGQFFQEWGIQKVDTIAQVNELVNKYGCHEIWGFKNPYITIRRRVDVENGIQKPWEWDILDFANGELDAANTFGDGAFYTAEGLHPLFFTITEYRLKITTLRIELTELENQITPNKFERQSLLESDFKHKYETALKTARLSKKVSQGIADPEKVKAIREPLQKEFMEEKTRIQNRIEEIKKELASL
jgi:hypothetical protein